MNIDVFSYAYGIGESSKCKEYYSEYKYTMKYKNKKKTICKFFKGFFSIFLFFTFNDLPCLLRFCTLTLFLDITFAREDCWIVAEI